MWYRCLDCGGVFQDGQLAERRAELEDSLHPYYKVMICPYCLSDQLEQLDVCPICCGPVTEEGTIFCADCRAEIDDSFESLFDSIHRPGMDRLDVIKLAFDRAEETNFYGTN